MWSLTALGERPAGGLEQQIRGTGGCFKPQRCAVEESVYLCLKADLRIVRTFDDRAGEGASAFSVVRRLDRNAAGALRDHPELDQRNIGPRLPVGDREPPEQRVRRKFGVREDGDSLPFPRYDAFGASCVKIVGRFGQRARKKRSLDNELLSAGHAELLVDDVPTHAASLRSVMRHITGPGDKTIGSDPVNACS